MNKREAIQQIDELCQQMDDLESSVLFAEKQLDEARRARQAALKNIGLTLSKYNDHAFLISPEFPDYLPDEFVAGGRKVAIDWDDGIEVTCSPLPPALENLLV